MPFGVLPPLELGYIALKNLPNEKCIIISFNPRLPKGGGLPPFNGLSPISPKRKTKWPRASK